MKKHQCKSYDGCYWWECGEYEDRLEVSVNIFEYVVPVKFCPFCGYSQDKNKDLIEKFRPTLEKLSKE